MTPSLRADISVQDIGNSSFLLFYKIQLLQDCAFYQDIYDVSFLLGYVTPSLQGDVPVQDIYDGRFSLLHTTQFSQNVASIQDVHKDRFSSWFLSALVRIFFIPEESEMDQRPVRDQEEYIPVHRIPTYHDKYYVGSKRIGIGEKFFLVLSMALVFLFFIKT